MDKKIRKYKCSRCSCVCVVVTRELPTDIECPWTGQDIDWVEIKKKHQRRCENVRTANNRALGIHTGNA